MMTKFLSLWEIDTNRLLEDPEEQMQRETVLMTMVKEDLESGKMLEWGMFPGGDLRGFAIDEGTELEITMMNLRYTPYVMFEVHPILSASQMEEMMKAMSQA